MLTRRSIYKILIGSVIVLLVSGYIKNQMRNTDTVITKPPDTVSIIIPTYNEAQYIERAVQSIRSQSIIQAYPEYFEIILVDSGSTDGTIELVSRSVDKVIIAPRGKLTARNIATNQSKGNIIVSVDGDSIYDKYWLNTLLQPFNNPNVVGISGSTFDNTLPFFIQNWIYILDHVNRLLFEPYKMSGRNSAYRKAYIQPFNENINQLNVNQMLREEEINFGKRLHKSGKVIYKINAPCQHLGGYRGLCRLNIPLFRQTECIIIGTERF